MVVAQGGRSCVVDARREQTRMVQNDTTTVQKRNKTKALKSV